MEGLTQRLTAVKSPLGSRAVSPSTPGMQPPSSQTSAAAGGTTKTRRTAEEKRRREETELRLLIQKEMDQARILHARILQNETQLASLAKQVDKQHEAAETERGGLQGEVKKWEKRLKQRQEAVAQKRQELEDMDNRVTHLKGQKNAQRICLASFFLRNDMKPDIAVDPEQIFTTLKGPGPSSPHHRHRSQRQPQQEGKTISLGGIRGAENDVHPAAADNADDAARRRSVRSNSRAGLAAGRKASVVVNELEIEPQLEHMRTKLHQIQHDANKVRSAATQAVRSDLQALYSELASLEHEITASAGLFESDDSGSLTPTAAAIVTGAAAPGDSRPRSASRSRGPVSTAQR
jgi:hypothetical protein